MTTPDLLARIDQRLVYPPFLVRWRATLAECAGQGAVFFATCGFRSAEDQMTDWLKGRETPGPDAGPDRPLGRTVTNARPYSSYHQYGLAGDSTYDTDPARPGLQPGWKREDYAVLARVATKNGLRSLGERLGDWPHIEAPIERYGLGLAQLRTVMKSARTPEEGLRRVWALCDERGVLRG